MTGPDFTPPASPQLAVRLRWLLIASLTLNLLVLGVGAGAVLNRALKGPPPVMVRDLGFGPFTEALTREDMQALRRDFTEALHGSRGGPSGPGLSRRQMRADAVAMLAALRRTPFDAAALQAAFDAQRSRMQERTDLGQDLLLARIAQMSPESRIALADRLERGMRRGPDGRRPDGKGADSGAPPPEK